MHPATQLLRITLFTRANCSLCESAKSVLRRVRGRRPFALDEVDVMAPGQGRWRDVYEFDTPVIHVDQLNAGGTGSRTTIAARKLMHRFQDEEVESLMDEVKKDTT